MNMAADEEIRNAATRFRLAIEGSLSELPPEMHSFPLGQCGTVTRLLGAYIEESGLGCFDYVTGGRIDPIEPQEGAWSHAWLEKEGLIVDITADQFAEKRAECVIVTRDLSWHRTFDHDVKNLGQAHFRYAPARIDEAAYRIILDALKKKGQ